MAAVVLASSTVGSIGLLPALCLAAGSSGFVAHIKSVHALIIEGDRPEISACLYSAELAVSNSRAFERLRWTDRISDESVVREYSTAADWVRETKFAASALTHGTGFFSRQRWVDVLVECRQVNEQAPVVTLHRSLDNR